MWPVLRGCLSVFTYCRRSGCLRHTFWTAKISEVNSISQPVLSSGMMLLKWRTACASLEEQLLANWVGLYACGRAWHQVMVGKKHHSAANLNTVKMSHWERGRNTPLFIVLPEAAGIYTICWLCVLAAQSFSFKASFSTQAGSRWKPWEAWPASQQEPPYSAFQG